MNLFFEARIQSTIFIVRFKDLSHVVVAAAVAVVVGGLYTCADFFLCLIR